ncbi:hypothetical protein, partial [Actinacidiphila yeochonensis]|uniref:hypothetical protein n=1 Tax=Actinacidiphila yeochonensis TaxID=89050 RepID=UPI00056976EA
MADLIGRARAAQHRAVRALAVCGPSHPIVHALLAAAATAAIQAWDAGHHVADLHPSFPAPLLVPRLATEGAGR